MRLGGGSLAGALRVACLSVLALTLSATDGPAVMAGRDRSLASPAARPATASHQAAMGPHPFLTVLCKFADASDEPRRPEYFERLLGSEYPGLDNYFREVSYDALNLDGSKVTGWFTLPGDRAAYVGADGKPNLLKLAQDCGQLGGAAIEPTRYFGLNLVFNADMGVPYGGPFCLEEGAACYGVTWMWPPWTSNQATWAHEMGHALGLGHSGRGAGRVYGDDWDVMSEDGACGNDPRFGRLAQQMIAYQKDRLGWIPADGKLLVAGPGDATFRLAPLATRSAVTGSYLLAQIPIEGSNQHFYTLEARARIGYDRNLLEDAVLIHEVDSRQMRGSTDDPVITLRWQGSSREDLMSQPFVDRQHGISVTVDGQAEEGFTVTVRIGAPDNSDADLPFAYGTPAAPGGATVSAGSPADAVAPVELPATRIASAVDAGGRRHALWVDVDHGPTTALRYAVRDPGKAWEPVETVESGADNGAVGAQAVVAGSDGTVYAGWSQLVDGYWQVWFAARDANTKTWSHPEVVSPMGSGDAWAPSLAVDTSGRLYLLWRSRYDCGSRIMSELILRVRGENGAWQQPERVDVGPTLTLIQSPRLAIAGNGVYVGWDEPGVNGASSYAAVRRLGNSPAEEWQLAAGPGTDSKAAAS